MADNAQTSDPLKAGDPNQGMSSSNEHGSAGTALPPTGRDPAVKGK